MLEKYDEYHNFKRKMIFHLHLLRVVSRLLIRRFYSYKTVYNDLFNRKKNRLGLGLNLTLTGRTIKKRFKINF
jgi:hypothetical protein